MHGACKVSDKLAFAWNALHQGGSRGAIETIALTTKIYETNFTHQNILLFGKQQHSRYKAILPSIVLSQQCCEVHFISHTVVNP